MRPWSTALLAAFVTVLACTLPLEDKAACYDSSDCLDGRACVAGQCTDDACGLACGALCEARDACVSERSCESLCDPAGSSLSVLGPAQCGGQYDLLADGECEALVCFEGCLATCERGVECALIDDAQRCVLACQEDTGDCPLPPNSCSALDSDALRCWSRGRDAGC